MKRLLIVTGPQGSGNHMWGKIFSETPQVQGWKELTQTYWVSHGNEPFANIWEDPSLFSKLDWPHEYYYTSISCPYLKVGGPAIHEHSVVDTPKYDEFINSAKSVGFEVTLAVIGRDKNILEHQQSRVRTKITYHEFLDNYDANLTKYDPLFISTELLYLYEDRYLKQVSTLLNWPIEISKNKLSDILKDNTNKKYLKSVDKYWLDQCMIEDSVRNGDPNNPNVYRAKNQ